MPVDTKFIGKEYPDIQYAVGQEKIKEYATAVGDLNPLYIDVSFAKKSKYGCVIAPPMFVVVYAQDMFNHVFLDKELNLNMPRLVHGEQEFNFHKIVKSNDTITTKSKIKNIFEKSKNNFVQVETKSYNQNNELVTEGLWTFVIRG